MSELITARPFTDGTYNVVIKATVGTAKIQMTTNEVSAQDITDASWSADAIVQISVPNCQLSAVITGDAQVFITPMRYS